MCSNIMDNQLLDNSKCCSEQNLMMTFKSRAPLELHTRHMVIVSAIDEETLTCCVQLLSLQTNLEQLMIQINNCKKYHFDEIPINGSTCIGQFKNGLYYRATVMGVGDINSLKLYSIDYGTTEMVSFAKVFQIDAEFILDKVYAYRFALHGLFLDPTLKKIMHEHFWNIVNQQVLELEVLPSKGSAIQYCNLFLDGKNVIDIINETISAACNIQLPKNNITFAELKVCKGSKHNVLVSYIETVSHFYIHLYEHKDQLDNVMEKLNIYCENAEGLSIEHLQVNMPCAALYLEDQIWYRAVILSLHDNKIKVQYVDYGNCETVDISCLKLLSEELISCLEAQALLCCLTGLDSINQNESTTTQLEMLCLEKILNMTVAYYDVNTGCAVVDLVDSNITPPLNVSKRIIELSSPRQNRFIASENKGLSHNDRKTPQLNNLQNTTPEAIVPNGFATEHSLKVTNENALSSQLQKCFMSQHQSKRFKDNLPSVMQQVAVSWFVNPHNFHCQLKCNDAKLVDLMKNIQTKYSKIKSNAFNAEVEDAVIVKYKQDNIMYRGRIVNIKEQRYLIQFVDYGFKDIVGPTDIFPIEDEFLLEPTFAIKCKINSIIPIRMDKSNLPQIYGFFKQNVYDCMFNETDANGYTNVELSHNGADVGLQLVENGFAIFASEDIRNDIEFDLLRGQFIKGKILGVKSFQIFFVNLFQTDSQFECGLYKWNCDENDPEYNKMRKSFCEMTENNTFIIYINEIQGTKLFVTLYDSSGCKVVPFSSDESISSVFPLCAKPVYRQNMNVIISHRNGDQAFIQEDSDMTLLSELLDNLFQFYENNGDMPQTELTEGNVCAAKSLLDSNWYRAIIIQSRENDYLVRYVDYGNEELLPFNNIKELSTAYYELYMLCLEVIASNDFCHDASDDLIKVNLSRKGKMWYLTSGHKLCNNEQSHPAPEISSKSNNVGHKDSIQTELTQTCDLVIVAHIDSPSQFWVQDASNKEALLHLQEVLQNIAEKLPSLTNLQVGRICVAKYSIDDLWYRAVILDADSDITTIRFIDFGNTDVIENSDNLLKDLDGELKQIEPLATKCSLLAASVEGDDWSENACKEFEEFVQLSETFKQNVLFKIGKCCYVELEHDGINITEQLIRNGHGITCDVSDIHDTSVLCSDSDVLTQKKTGYISHFVDLNEFYVQLECDRAGLEFLEDALSNAASFPVCKNPVKDVVCVAQFADDMLWYRASILNVLPDCYEVFFIDFGNTGTTKEIRDMPASLDNIGQLAKQCYIFIPDDLSSLSFEIGQKLQEISGDGLTIFDIEFMSLCSPYKTQLILNGENIIEKILSEHF